jgi:hypothetical protein
MAELFFGRTISALQVPLQYTACPKMGRALLWRIPLNSLRHHTESISLCREDTNP